MASETPPTPTGVTPVRSRYSAPPPPEDPDLDPETHPARSGRHHGGGDNADVPF
jgi:hypothetical protein